MDQCEKFNFATQELENPEWLWASPHLCTNNKIIDSWLFENYFQKLSALSDREELYG